MTLLRYDGPYHWTTVRLPMPEIHLAGGDLATWVDVVGDIAGRMRARSLSLLLSSSIASNHAGRRLVSGLASRFTVEVLEHELRASPREDELPQLVKQLRSHDPDIVVAAGGGATTDAAKATIFLEAEGGKFTDHASSYCGSDGLHESPHAAAKRPLVVVPTTLSGAELTPATGAVVVSGEKRAVWDPALVPVASIYSPTLLRQVPPQVITATAFSALAHCTESVYSHGSSPIATAFGRAGVDVLGRGLRLMSESAGPNVPDESTAAKLLEGAILGGLALTHARPAFHHALVHALVAVGGVSHSLAHATLFRCTMMAASRHLDREGELGRLLAGLVGGTGPHEPGELDRALRELTIALGLPTSLSAIVEADLREDILAHALRDRGMHFTPAPPGLTHADLIEVVLEDAFA